MKHYFWIFTLLAVASSVNGQHQILYDLDSYRRVDGQWENAFINPDLNLNYSTTVNDPNQEKDYAFNLGMAYYGTKIVNNAQNQKRRYKRVDVNYDASRSEKELGLLFDYQYENRSYRESQGYFKSGFRIRTNSEYASLHGFLRTYSQYIDPTVDLGFGFGRLELINDAWRGARILEELNKKDLLLTIPSSEEMKAFFDLVGDLNLERVMDDRLRDIHQLEQIILFLQDRKWIERESVPAFASIYDAFRFESFVTRWSGRRLEFTLTPRAQFDLQKETVLGNQVTTNFRPGFYGEIQYRSEKNGDLAYYTTTNVTARLGYQEHFDDGQKREDPFLDGNIELRYQYNYLPSLRTHLRASFNVIVGAEDVDVFEAYLNANASLRYNYYFSPATQLEIFTVLRYRDNEFQSGDYQPRITARVNVQVVHALR